jgi:hypothetical protein
LFLTRAMLAASDLPPVVLLRMLSSRKGVTCRGAGRRAEGEGEGEGEDASGASGWHAGV